MLALSVAGVLAVFLVYTALAGGGTPAVTPGEVAAKQGRVSLAGRVVGEPTGNSRSPGGLRFTLRDPAGTATVRVVYRGTVPDPFKVGRDIVVDGRMQRGVFVAVPGTMITKCPSKYTPKKDT